MPRWVWFVVLALLVVWLWVNPAGAAHTVTEGVGNIMTFFEELG